MGKIFYHNLTQEKFNETELIDFMDDYENGDRIVKTEAGCALLEEITPDELRQMKIRHQEYYEEEEL